MNREIIVSIKTVLFTIGLLIAGYLIYQLQTIFGILLVSTLLTISLEPGVKFFMSYQVMGKDVNRGWASGLMYLFFVLSLIVVFTFVLPPILGQAVVLLGNLASQARQIPLLAEYTSVSSSIVPQLSNFSGSALNFLLSIFSNVFVVFTVLIVSLYMSLDWPNIKEKAIKLAPRKARKDTKTVFEEVEVSIGHWVKGQLTLMLVVGLLSTVGLLALGVPYALALGLISGLLELVPLVGPILSAVLAGIIGFSSSSFKGFAVIILFTLIQQLENNLLVPKIMQKVSGFSPLVVLIALLVGSELFGVVGAVLAIPLMMIFMIILHHVMNFK